MACEGFREPGALGVPPKLLTPNHQPKGQTTMRILLNDKAASHYVQRCYRHAHPACGQLHNPKFAAMLEAVQGKWLEVETDYLFKDQFNTVPIPGVSELGLRVMATEVVAIEDDERLGAVKCGWCGAHQPEADGPHCTTCDKGSEFLMSLDPRQSERRARRY